MAPVGSLLALLLAGADLALKRHAQQGLLAGIIGTVVFFVVGLVLPGGTLLATAFWLYLVYCGVRAYQGQEVRIPLLSSLEF